MLKKSEPFYWLVLAATAWTAVACVSTNAGAGRTVLEHQQQVAELEARNADLERRLAAYDGAVGNSVSELKAIRDRGLGVEGTVDQVIKLFGDYQRAVEQLIRSYDNVKNTSGRDVESGDNTASDTWAANAEYDSRVRIVR